MERGFVARGNLYFRSDPDLPARGIADPPIVGPGCARLLTVRAPPDTVATPAGTTFPRRSCCEDTPTSGGGALLGSCGHSTVVSAAATVGLGTGALEAGRAWGGRVCPRDSGDMRGAASAAGSAGPRELGSPARRGALRTKLGAGRCRTAATQAAFVRRGPGRPRSKNGLTSKGQGRAVTTGLENRGEGDRWPCGSPGTNSSLSGGRGKALGQGPSRGPGVCEWCPQAPRLVGREHAKV